MSVKIFIFDGLLITLPIYLIIKVFIIQDISVIYTVHRLPSGIYLSHDFVRAGDVTAENN